MRPSAYYNEIDPYCAEWLRNLIVAGEIPAGDVDDRPIEEVSADDVRPYTQCHFFAGIGGWALAARLAGWRDTDPIWTGSCPCQPYSAAGKRLADRDPRNLWPDFARLIAECRPARVAGEQVASKAGRLWLAGVREDLEALGYAVGAADLCAAGVNTPHIRQRLWWVADAERARVSRGSGEDQSAPRGVSAEVRQQRIRAESVTDGGDRGCDAGGMADADSRGLGAGAVEAGRGVVETEPGREGSVGGSRLGYADEQGESGRRVRRSDEGTRPLERPACERFARPCADSRMGNAEYQGLEGHAGDGAAGEEPGRQPADEAGSITEAGRYSWGNNWIPCADGKARRIEPGIEPLVDGVSFEMGSGSPLQGKKRVGMVRAYGNAIVPQLAAEFIRAYMETDTGLG